MILGLVGKSLTHSFSKSHFEKKFEQEGIQASYSNFEFQNEQELKIFLDKKEFHGLNVTIPYKESIIPFLDDLSEEANSIGAVNTVLNKNGKLIGFNTDAFGFHQSIKPYFKSRHERALILGTGGASKAVEYVLKNLGCEVVFASRTPNKPNEFSYDDINDYMLQHHKIIINCTPVGMYPNVEKSLTLPFNSLTSDHLVVDLIYNPSETLLLKKAKQQKTATINGLVMLREQAQKAWNIWTEKSETN